MKNSKISKTVETTFNNSIDEIKYITMLCNEKSDLILKTEFGIGRYKFTKFNELQGHLVLEFQLLKDNRFKDTNSINQNIGNTCFLTIHQYLSVYSYLAQA